MTNDEDKPAAPVPPVRRKRDFIYFSIDAMAGGGLQGKLAVEMFNATAGRQLKWSPVADQIISEGEYQRTCEELRKELPAWIYHILYELDTDEELPPEWLFPNQN